MTDKVKPRLRSHDWVERALQEWGAWVPAFGDAQGWGGGAERDIVQNVVYGRPQRSGHADPMLSELIATLDDNQGQSQRVHCHLLRYAREKDRTWLAVPWARYVGERVATGFMPLSCHGEIEIARHYRLPICVDGATMRNYRWSGMLAMEQVSRVTGVRLRSAEALLSVVKRELRMDLLADSKIGRGAVIPDGAPSPAEVRAGLTARHRRRADRRVA